MQDKVFQGAVDIVGFSKAVSVRCAVDHTMLHFFIHAGIKEEKKNHISECHTITPLGIFFSKMIRSPDAALQNVVLTQRSRRSTPVCCSRGSGTFQELYLEASPRPASGSAHPQTSSSHPDVANSSRLPSTHTC